MGYPASIIPEKIFFKIGEVCDLVGVQAHVLRYWETEFPMLSPQKNRSGQRTYRRRDVEIAMRIKELLYDELFTIAGAKKKLQTELREASRLKIVQPETIENPVEKDVVLKTVPTAQPTEADFEPDGLEADYADLESKFQPEFFSEYEFSEPRHGDTKFENKSAALRNFAAQLLELREMLKAKKSEDQSFRLRKY
jgi:DNA-binding transcriptional MerR regulator